MFKRITLASLSALMLLSGCSSSESSTPSTSETVTYADALEVLQAVWDEVPEDDRFMVIGGYGDDIVENGPGTIDTQSADVAQIFQLPENALFEAVSAASLQHALMANNFTAVVLQYSNGTDLNSLADQIDEYASSAQWICSIPQEYQIFEYEDYLIFIYGSEDLDKIFTDAAMEVLPDLENLYTREVA